MMNTRLMRTTDPRDREFVVPTWVRSYADVSLWPKRLVLDSHWSVVDALLADPATRVVLLCSGDGNALHGWAAADTRSGALHWAYVPPELRGRGFARRAITTVLDSYPVPLMMTHPMRAVPSHVRMNPYPMMRDHDRERNACSWHGMRPDITTVNLPP